MATFAIDPAHTDVLFSAKHMMVTTVHGKFEQVEGESIVSLRERPQPAPRQQRNATG